MERYKIDQEKMKRLKRGNMPLGTETLLHHMRWYEMSLDQARRTNEHILEFLENRPELKAAFDAWRESGGGTSDDFRRWLKDAAQKKQSHLHLIWHNPKQPRYTIKASTPDEAA